MDTSLVTLTTDFGTRDGYAGAVRGVIHALCPAARVVDIAHDLPPHDILHGAFVIASACPWYPEGTVHLGVVDPGVGGPRRALALRTRRHFYIGPDNGLFTLVFARQEVVGLRFFDADSLGLPEPHPTFHARDLFAPAAAFLAGGKPFDALGWPASNPEQLNLRGPASRGEGRLALAVLNVDRFGNVVLPLGPEDLAGLGQDPLRPGLGLAGQAEPLPLRRAYVEGRPGEFFLLWGSAGFLELAQVERSAAEALGLRSGSVLELVRFN